MLLEAAGLQPACDTSRENGMIALRPSSVSWVCLPDAGRSWKGWIRTTITRFRAARPAVRRPSRDGELRPSPGHSHPTWLLVTRRQRIELCSGGFGIRWPPGGHRSALEGNRTLLTRSTTGPVHQIRTKACERVRYPGLRPRDSVFARAGLSRCSAPSWRRHEGYTKQRTVQRGLGRVVPAGV